MVSALESRPHLRTSPVQRTEVVRSSANYFPVRSPDTGSWGVTNDERTTYYVKEHHVAMLNRSTRVRQYRQMPRRKWSPSSATPAVQIYLGRRQIRVLSSQRSLPKHGKSWVKNTVISDKFRHDGKLVYSTVVVQSTTFGYHFILRTHPRAPSLRSSTPSYPRYRSPYSAVLHLEIRF